MQIPDFFKKSGIYSILINFLFNLLIVWQIKLIIVLRSRAIARDRFIANSQSLNTDGAD
jgi:hypothetical protein